MDPKAREELESKIAFLERTVDDLSEMILAQTKSIDALAARLLRVEGRMHSDSSGEDGPRDLADDRPPHY